MKIEGVSVIRPIRRVVFAVINDAFDLLRHMEHSSSGFIMD